MVAPLTWTLVALLASAFLPSSAADETPGAPTSDWVVAADAPASELPAPQGVVVLESVLVRGVPHPGTLDRPEIRAIDAETEARLRTTAPACVVLRPAFCPPRGTLRHLVVTPTAHIVGNVFVRTHADLDRLFVDVDVIRSPHELTAASVLVERERSGMSGLSSATPWSLDGPPIGESMSTCAVWLPPADASDEVRVLLIRARRLGVALETHVEDWSSAESSWFARWREHAGATRPVSSTIVDFALLPLSDVKAFAPPASAVLEPGTAALQVFRDHEADATAWSEALRAIDNWDGIVSSLELSQRALDGSELGIASWCWNEDASWDVAISRGPDGTFRVHVAQTPIRGGVERSDLAFGPQDHDGVVYVFAGHPTEPATAGLLVLALRVRDAGDDGADAARAAWDALWDMSP